MASFLLSTIYEQEKVNLWSEKVRLASDAKALNMLSSDWAYHNIFGLPQDEVDIERAKRRKAFCSRSKSWSGERGIAARKRWRC